MALVWCDETNGAVTMLMVVPMHECADPLAGSEQVLERPVGIVGSVFQCLEERFRIRVVIADRRSTERGHYPQGLQGGQHRGTFHRAAIVRVQHYLVRCNVFPLANITHDRTGQFTALSLVDLPAYDFSAKNIQKQVKVKIDADDPSRQIRDVPAEQLIGGRCTQCTRLAALLFGSLRATVLKFALSFENAVKGRLRGDVLARIGQSGNDLAGREMPELIRVGPVSYTHLTLPT